MKKTAYLFLLLWMALTGANGQTCFQVGQSNSGIPLLYTNMDLLVAKACQLKDLITPSYPSQTAFITYISVTSFYG